MKKFWPQVIFLVLSAVIIFSWFRFGLIYGGGDVGLQTYNPKRILENARFVWWDSAAPGAPIPQGLSAVPFQFILFLFQSIGFSPLALQATLFFVLLFLMGYGMYLFLEYKLEGGNKLYPVVGGLFYMLNPYMMIQVWHRFIHTTIFLAASLPFLAIFWSNWIKKGSFKNFLLFLLTNVLSVYLFGTFAFIITVWVFLTLITVSELIPWQGRRKLIVVASRFLYGFIIWLLINCWWLIPVFKISPVVLSEQHKTEESLVTLINISAQAILPYTLQLTNPFYLFFQADFGPLYKNPMFQLIPWLFVLLIFLGFVFSLKQKKYAPFGIFFIVSVFLAKGVSPPFGNLYIQGFINFFPLGVLRNPFEKTGLILVFFATILFMIGFKTLGKLIEEKINWMNTKLFSGLVLLLILIYSWPIWTGQVLGGLKKESFVDVPQSYKLADQWLIEQKLNGIKDGKILHLPLTTGESIKYKWKYGYNGLEPSDTFFTAFPSISRGFNIKRIDDALTSLSFIFERTYFDKELALKYLQDFNVRFIVLHKDIDWLGMDLYDPLETEKLLDGLEFIQRKKEFGDLVLYQLNDKYYQAKVSLSSNFNLIYPGEDILKQPYFLNKSLMVTPINEVDEGIVQQSSQTVIFPKNSFKYGISSESAQLSEDLLVKQLEEYKISLDKMGFILSRGLTEKIIKASKILFEDSPKDINEYQELIKQIFHQDFDKSRFASSGEESVLSTIFRFHLLALSRLESTSSNPKISQAKQLLIQEMTANNLFPQYPISDNLKRQFFKFYIPAAGTYTVETLNQSFLEGFTVNGDKTFRMRESLNLEQGDLEISFPTRLSVNLAAGLNQLKVSEGAGKRYIEVPITNLSFGGTYSISLYIKSDQPANLRLMLYETSKDGFDFTGTASAERNLLVYPQAPRYLVNFEVKPATKTAIFAIELPIGVNILDVKVQRILDDPLILVSTGRENSVEDQSVSVKLNYESPILYQGSIKIEKPSFLFFRETFHPGWKLSLNRDGREVIPTQHLLADLYGNAWYIEDEGEYDFKIEFEPQKYVNIGILLTLLGGTLIPVGIYIRRKVKI